MVRFRPPSDNKLHQLSEARDANHLRRWSRDQFDPEGDDSARPRAGRGRLKSRSQEGARDAELWLAYQAGRTFRVQSP